jgi:DNA invertase Pin-like site-specific DNA recombinase
MKLGYVRVSTLEQTLALQQDELTAAGCEKILTDTISGSKAERPGITKALEQLRAGDTLVVWRLDRLGRSLPHLIVTIIRLRDQGVEFRNLHEQIDTSTPSGKLIFHMFGALAEFERDIIRERTLAGLAAALGRGRKGGRPRRVLSKQILQAQHMFADKSNSIQDICQTLHISKTTLYRYLKTLPSPQSEERP